MNNWIVKETEVLMKTPIGSFCSTKKVDPKGVERNYISMQAPNWVCAVVQLGKGADRFLMVRQFRHGINRLIDEFPAGMVDGEENAQEALLRELDEEIGVKQANVVELNQLFVGSPNPAFMTNRITCFHVVVDGFSHNHPDSDEFLETKEFNRSEIEQIVLQEDFNVMMRLAWELVKKRELI